MVGNASIALDEAGVASFARTDDTSGGLAADLADLVKEDQLKAREAAKEPPPSARAAKAVKGKARGKAAASKPAPDAAKRRWVVSLADATGLPLLHEEGVEAATEDEAWRQFATKRGIIGCDHVPKITLMIDEDATEATPAEEPAVE